MTERETPQHLLDELREVLGPMLCGLSDDDPIVSLYFAEGQLADYGMRVGMLLMDQEADNGDNTT